MNGDLWLCLAGVVALSLTHIAMWRDGYRSGQIESTQKAIDKLRRIP